MGLFSGQRMQLLGCLYISSYILATYTAQGWYSKQNDSVMAFTQAPVEHMDIPKGF